jgi:hypothetical protein
MAKKPAQKSGNSWPLDQRPGFLIRRLHQIHVALFQKRCAAFEITPLQYSLLSALAKRGTADQTTLADDVASIVTRPVRLSDYNPVTLSAFNPPPGSPRDLPAEKSRGGIVAPNGSGPCRPP